MFQSVQHKRETDAAVAVDIAPLIDIVFILLIFFLVTTTFMRDEGVEVTRPQAAQSQTLAPEALRVQVTGTGHVFVDGRPTPIEQLAAQVRAFVNRHATSSVIVVADERVAAKRLVEVVDEARTGGASDIALATRRKEPGS